MSLKQFLNQLNEIDADYDVSFILHDYNDIDPNFFGLSWLSDNAYNKLYPIYSIEDPDATHVVDIAQIKHIKTLPDWLLDIPDYCYTSPLRTRDELGINIVDIEVYTDRIIHLYIQNNKNTEVL